MARSEKAKPKAKSPPESPSPESKPRVKSNLSAADLRLFRTLLIHRRAILRGDVDSMEGEGLRTAQEGGGGNSSVPLHLADLGSDAFEQDMTLGLLESESDELQEIEEALNRIEDGSFGICEICMKTIPKPRLRAIPYTRLCIPCKKKEEGAEKKIPEV